LDLILTEIVGLTAQTARAVADADWCLAGMMTPLGIWLVEGAHAGGVPPVEFLQMWHSAAAGAGSHPELLFSSKYILLKSTHPDHWLALGWLKTSGPTPELSAGQKHIISNLEISLVPDGDQMFRSRNIMDTMLKEILEQSNDMMAVLDIDGTLIGLSQPLAEEFGWQTTALVGRPVPLVWSGGSIRKGSLLSAAARGSVLRSEVHLVRKSGEPVPMAARLAGLGEGDLRRILLTLRPEPGVVSVPQTS
jgi:PAS domain S-box-containing protein